MDRGLVVVDDGCQAVDLIKSDGEFDVILMDLHMPVMDGMEATSLIRKMEAAGDTPRHFICAMTADVVAEQDCFSTDMDKFISKPVFPSELREVLQARLEVVRAHEHVKDIHAEVEEKGDGC
mmetsp:Transcript_27891/g.33875  ORF Transcript_27891/g.33875 Transcript_27891/m.33875 type:complete len:122 (-) Transcript_27891:169-534(-)